MGNDEFNHGTSTHDENDGHQFHTTEQQQKGGSCKWYLAWTCHGLLGLLLPILPLMQRWQQWQQKQQWILTTALVGKIHYFCTVAVVTVTTTMINLFPIPSKLTICTTATTTSPCNNVTVIDVKPAQAPHLQRAYPRIHDDSKEDQQGGAKEDDRYKIYHHKPTNESKKYSLKIVPMPKQDACYWVLLSLLLSHGWLLLEKLTFASWLWLSLSPPCMPIGRQDHGKKNWPFPISMHLSSPIFNLYSSQPTCISSLEKLCHGNWHLH